MRAVLRAFARVQRLRVLERDAASVHAVARSAWLRMPYDIHVSIDSGAGFIHLRVATPVALRLRSQSRTRAMHLLALIERELRAG